VSAVIFDLDGTILDTAPDIRAVANGVLAEAGGAPPLTLEETRAFVGEGAGRFIARIIAARGLAPGLHGRMHAAFLARYDGAVALTRPMAGAVEALAALAGAGHRLGVCTNKPEAPARAVLAHFSLGSVFTVVIGGDSLSTRKPDPAPLRAALGALGGGSALFVGDSETDSATARAAAAAAEIYTEGYRKSAVADIAHDALFSDFADLPAIAVDLARAA